MIRKPSFAAISLGFPRSRGARKPAIARNAVGAAEPPRPRWADVVREARERIRARAKRPFPWPYY